METEKGGGDGGLGRVESWGVTGGWEVRQELLVKGCCWWWICSGNGEICVFHGTLRERVRRAVGQVSLCFWRFRG